MTQERSEVPEQFLESGQGVADTRLASPKQVDYLIAMRDGKDLSSLTDEQRAWLATADFTKLTGGQDGQASRVIGQLKGLPWKPRTTQPPAAIMAELPHVLDGRYAVKDPMDDSQDVKFFKVHNGRSKVFLDVYASDARHPIWNLEHIRAVLTEIAKDPNEAMKAFGQKMGKCGRCGRSLTDETSRRFGIGPDCREMMGL